MMWMGLELLETGWDMMPVGHCIQVRHGGEGRDTHAGEEAQWHGAFVLCRG